jgi:hypothetical protein
VGGNLSTPSYRVSSKDFFKQSIELLYFLSIGQKYFKKNKMEY